MCLLYLFLLPLALKDSRLKLCVFVFLVMRNVPHLSPVCFVFLLLHLPCLLLSPLFFFVPSLPTFSFPSGLSKSFPLDNSLFDSWLAQSVQITADDMLSQWALGAQHRDKSGSLLSDQVGLQLQEALNIQL